MSDLPPLPKGFVLDGEQQGALPPLPAGFKIDAQPQNGNAISDILPEMTHTASAHLANIKGMYGGTSDNGVIQQTLNVGRGLGSIIGAIPDTLIGAPARSILGHGMATAEHAIGSVINPQVAAQDNPQEMYQTAKGDVDTAMMGLAPRGASPAGIRTAAPPVPPPADIKAAANGAYDTAKNAGIELKPSSIQNVTAKIQSDLNADGLNEVLAPKTFGVLDALGQPPPGSTVGVNDFRTMQRSLGHAAKSPDPTERLAASRAIETLNNHIENLPPGDLVRGTPQDAADVSQTIKTGNANYAAYKRSEDFNLRGEKAQNNADAANSGMNLENNLRTQVRQILNNPKLQRGYDVETLAAMKEFNRGTRTANIIRMVGNALGGGGGWGSLAASAVGHLAVPFVGAALPAVGFGIKAAGNARASSQFNKLSEMIRARSPLAQSLSPVPAPLPNPLLSAGISPQLLQMLGLGPRPMLGMVPARADQQQ